MSALRLDAAQLHVQEGKEVMDTITLTITKDVEKLRMKEDDFGDWQVDFEQDSEFFLKTATPNEISWTYTMRS